MVYSMAGSFSLPGLLSVLALLLPLEVTSVAPVTAPPVNECQRGAPDVCVWVPRRSFAASYLWGLDLV